MKKENYFSRRDILKGVGATCGLSLIHDQLICQIVESFVSSAHAAPGMLSHFYYINFMTPGGAPRWYFDLPLVPNGNDPFIANAQVITTMKMDKDKNVTGKYEHTKMGDYFLPLLWSYPIPLSSGGTGKLDELASSGLFIRGIDQGVDGHEINTLRQNSPVPGGLTYSGLFADTGDSPIPAASSYQSRLEHRSAKNKAIIQFFSRADLKVLSTAFNSFKTLNPLSFNRKNMAERAINAAVKSIQKNQGTNSPYMSAIKANRDNAMELLSTDFNSIDDEYSAIFNKYNDLILAALQIQLPGVTDSPIYARSGDRRFNIFVSDIVRRASDKTGDILHGFRSIKPNPNFVHAFALAEFLITKNLSTSVVTNLGFWLNFDVINYNTFNPMTQKFDLFESASKFQSISPDVHDTGTFPALVMFTRHFHSYATCLHELVTVLKAKKIYDQTLIHTTSDFNRIPRNAGNGSDHGFSGSATSLFTGRVTRPLVVGNIAQNAEGRGTWGQAALNDSLGGRKINLGNVASTICSIFELTSPAKNDSSLINIDSSKIVLAPKDKPKNIA